MRFTHHAPTTSRKPYLEALEDRTLLAGDVVAGLGPDGLLSIEGDDARNSVLVRELNRSVGDAEVVRGGATDVVLDAPLLAAAANLVVSSVNGTPVTLPPDLEPEVEFPITAASDFRLSEDGRFPILGQIAHEGTVGFNGDAIVVGNFDIGFDASRAGGAASGFYVADTVAGLGILFDVGSPELAVGDSSLEVTSSDLLVSPEFAGLLRDLGLASADLTGADVGDASVDAMTALRQQRLVNDGATSVVLDTPLLQSVGLKLEGATPTAESSLDGGVGFEIGRDSSLQFLIAPDGSDLLPQGGQITHTGTVTFSIVGGAPSDLITVGDFAIGFDADRISTDPAASVVSGFYVEDTFGELGILFDVASPQGLDYSGRTLNVGPADLLVSPEFAGVLSSVLGVDDLTGTDVGDAQIDADVTNRLPLVEVKGMRWYGSTKINGSAEVLFPKLDVESLAITTGAGRDYVRVYGVSLTGSLHADVGAGRVNWVTIYDVQAGSLHLSGGSGRDRFTVRNSHVDSLMAETGSGQDRVTFSRTEVGGDAQVNLGGDSDVLSAIASDIAGHALFDGGSGRFDRLLSLRTDYGSLDDTNFAWRIGH